MVMVLTNVVTCTALGVTVGEAVLGNGLIGAFVGTRVGNRVVGATVGNGFMGAIVGVCVGNEVVGDFVGVRVGSGVVGAFVGVAAVSSTVGTKSEGEIVGSWEGERVVSTSSVGWLVVELAMGDAVFAAKGSAFKGNIGEGTKDTICMGGDVGTVGWVLASILLFDDDANGTAVGEDEKHPPVAHPPPITARASTSTATSTCIGFQ
jgi:hypothetical protein